MSLEVDDIVGELMALQSRRGLQGPWSSTQVGPLLSQAFRLDRWADDEHRRRECVAGLTRHAEGLPPDLRYVFLRACAVQSADRPALSERLEQAGNTMKVHARTAWRRRDMANRRVAESIATTLRPAHGQAPPEWMLLRLDASLDLRERRPVNHSQRTIRVVSPYLEELTESVSFPGAPSDADPEFSVGGDCVLDRITNPYPSNWTMHLRLAREYGSGEEATYSVAVRVPSRRLVHPMSVMLPMRECRTFVTEVHFGTPSVAARVWRLDGVPAPVAEVDEPCGEIIDTTANPFVRIAFEDMQRGRVYGLRWQWADAVADG